jgi:hypothetical protein
MMKRTAFLLAAAVLLSCGGGPSTPAPKPAAVEPAALPEFDAGRAVEYVRKQVEFGPRVPNTRAHEACAEWLAETFRTWTPHVMVQRFSSQAFDGTELRGRNIVAEFNVESEERILLCAHWDSRPFADYDPDPANWDKPIDGANDGASGVGVLLEIGRQLSRTEPPVGVDILLLDLEDYGEHRRSPSSMPDSWGLGSQYWAKNPHRPGYTARFGILLDMVGASGAHFTMEGTSMLFAPHIMRKVWNTARELGYGKFFLEKESGPLIDDHLYINRYARIPTIDIIDYDDDRMGFFDAWHTTGDTMEVIDPKPLEAVGRTVLAVIFREKAARHS